MEWVEDWAFITLCLMKTRKVSQTVRNKILWYGKRITELFGLKSEPHTVFGGDQAQFITRSVPFLQPTMVAAALAFFCGNGRLLIQKARDLRLGSASNKPVTLNSQQ